ncbi:MAG: hypothetical protein JWN36_2667 [Microbacteriaceae bacterium]|nr:hypothetical protein [Microbacteriaceae bacterium]
MGQARMTAGPPTHESSNPVVEEARARRFGRPILRFASGLPDIEFLGYAWQSRGSTDERVTAVYASADRSTVVELSSWLDRPWDEREDVDAVRIAALEFVPAHDRTRQDSSPRAHRRLVREMHAIPVHRSELAIGGEPTPAVRLSWDGIHAYVTNSRGVCVTIGSTVGLEGHRLTLS